MTKQINGQLPERLPKLIVFDLDYTVWPTWIDCYSAPPYTYNAERNTIRSRYEDEEIGLYRDIPDVFALIKSMPDTKIAIASRTTTPEWAIHALKLLRIPTLNSTTMYSNIDYFEIYPSSKIKHFTALTNKTGIPCNQMLFFDDEWRNREVESLGVHFVHVDSRKGVTMDTFMNALTKYSLSSRYTQTKLDFSKH